MAKKIWFDMDGTLADLYNVENWLYALEHSDSTPYEVARPLVNMSLLARLLNRLQRNGYEIGICSWLCRCGSDEYNAEVTAVKIHWLEVHLRSVQFDHIDIIPYGEPKHNGREGILFDDNAKVRKGWGENAYTEKEIIEILKSL